MVMDCASFGPQILLARFNDLMKEGIDWFKRSDVTLAPHNRSEQHGIITNISPHVDDVIAGLRIPTIAVRQTD